MILYKLTDKNSMTRSNTLWGENIKYEVQPVENPKLCSEQVLHAYKGVNLALLLNPIHVNFDELQLWEAEGKICVEDWGKVGCFKLKTTKILELPEWYQKSENRRKVQIIFSILCAEAVLKNFENVFPDDDRPRKAIQAAKEYLKVFDKESAAWSAAESAARSAAESAARSARSAAESAARSAAESAAWSAAESAARSAAWSAWSAARSAAESAARSARSAAEQQNIDFALLANKAVQTLALDDLV
jgi:hypothetical protein